jgi:hypothetical protein
MNERAVTEKSIPEEILESILQAIASKEYGSVEIYIESGRVVQITERTIRKTDRLNNTQNQSVRWYGNKG